MTLSSQRKRSLYMIEDFVFDLAAPIRETPGGSLNYPPLTWKRGFSVSWTIRWFSYLIGHNSGCTWPSLRLTLIRKLQLLQAERTWRISELLNKFNIVLFKSISHGDYLFHIFEILYFLKIFSWIVISTNPNPILYWVIHHNIGLFTWQRGQLSPLSQLSALNEAKTPFHLIYIRSETSDCCMINKLFIVLQAWQHNSKFQKNFYSNLFLRICIILGISEQVVE